MLGSWKANVYLAAAQTTKVHLTRMKQNTPLSNSDTTLTVAPRDLSGFENLLYALN
jgi:hypothetical protein